MNKLTKLTREQFEEEFRSSNASWSFEGAGFSGEEKELLYKRLVGQISQEEYLSYFLKGREKQK